MERSTSAHLIPQMETGEEGLASLPTAGASCSAEITEEKYQLLLDLPPSEHLLRLSFAPSPFPPLHLNLTFIFKDFIRYRDNEIKKLQESLMPV